MAMADDDDLDWDEWMELSDAQQEAIFDREMAEYSRRFNALTPLAQYRYRRRRGLETCLGWRRRIRAIDIPTFHERLHISQRLLLKARADFYHGTRGQA
jgi:hypothetical protein